jgi:hypothetical protein
MTDDITYMLEAMGFVQGTPAFEREFELARVQKCQQLQGVGTCFACKAFDGCEVAKNYLRGERERAFEAGRRAGETEARLVRSVQAFLPKEKDSGEEV